MAARTAERQGVRLDFVLRHGRSVDLDSLAEVALAGLRDGGALPARLATLDVVVATKVQGDAMGVTIALSRPEVLDREALPGPSALQVAVDLLPRPGQRDQKRALRAAFSDAWGGRALLTGTLWADLAMATSGSLLGPLEPVLDTLEPVLGRDPRGQRRQEFFPNDDRIVWLRVRRAPAGAPRLRLALGQIM